MLESEEQNFYKDKRPKHVETFEIMRLLRLLTYENRRPILMVPKNFDVTKNWLHAAKAIPSTSGSVDDNEA